MARRIRGVGAAPEVSAVPVAVRAVRRTVLRVTVSEMRSGSMPAWSAASPPRHRTRAAVTNPRRGGVSLMVEQCGDQPELGGAAVPAVGADGDGGFDHPQRQALGLRRDAAAVAGPAGQAGMLVLAGGHRQISAVGERMQDRRQPIGAGPPQQVRARRSGRAGQWDAVAAAIGQQQHAWAQGPAQQQRLVLLRLFPGAADHVEQSPGPALDQRGQPHQRESAQFELSGGAAAEREVQGAVGDLETSAVPGHYPQPLPP